MKNIQNFLNFNESLAGKVDSRLVSKYKKWLESEKPDYFGGDRDLELRRNTFFKELDKYSSSKERSRILNLLDSEIGTIPSNRSFYLKMYSNN
jgi:hypothetical protein